MTVKTLSKDDIIGLHKELINAYGGTHGVRDDALFDSAIAAPFQSFGGVDFYPSIEEKPPVLDTVLPPTTLSTMVIKGLVRTPCSYSWLSMGSH